MRSYDSPAVIIGHRHKHSLSAKTNTCLNVNECIFSVVTFKVFVFFWQQESSSVQYGSELVKGDHAMV